jgi:hypothetical protein
MRKPLSKTQAVCLFLLWIVLCSIVLVSVKQIDGPLILSLLVSGVLVWIPLQKVFQKNK